jgi:imidazolonepropionase
MGIDMRIDTLWKNANLVTLVPSASGANADRLGLLADCAIAALDGRIVYAGARADLPT